MSANAIDRKELEKAVARLGANFVTKDVSEQEALRASHPELATQRYWHAWVGRALSIERVTLGIDSIGRSSSRGERWAKGGRARIPPAEPRPAPATSSDSGAEVGLGPQSSGDPPFTARMRLHQSWWRAHVLKVPCGFGPQESSRTRYGNMLDGAAGGAGLNFLTPEIFAVARRRLAASAAGVEPYRLLHNLLSSQPMAFNLFGPLVDQPERALRMLRALFGDEVARVLTVSIEWAPTPPDEYLGDHTSFDVFIDYERSDGARVAVGLETKLTDSFSQTPYDRESYRRWMRSERSPFLEAAWSDVALPRHNQLWRNHLLAIAMRDRSGSAYPVAKSGVVLHPLDAAGASVIASYRSLLRPGDDTFFARTADEVIGAFGRAAQDDAERTWLDAFRTRYLALELSAGLTAGR